MTQLIKANKSIVRKNSAGSEIMRRRLNLIEGSNITLTVADDDTNNEIDITIAAASSSLAIGDAVSGGTEGSLLFVDSSGNLAQDNANLFWDDTNNRLGVGINSSLGSTLHVKGSGATSSTSAFRVQNSSGTSILYAGDDGRVGILTASPDSSVVLHIRDTAGNNHILADSIRGTAVAGGIYLGRFARTGPAIVQADDRISSWIAQGYDGATYRELGRFTFASDGTPGSSDMPGRFEFATTKDGAASATERMRLDSAGLLTLRDGTTIHHSFTSASGDEVVINETGANIDFRVEGDTVTHLFHVDASTDRIVIGSSVSSPDSILHLRPSSAGVVDAPTSTVLTLESSTNVNALSFLSPNTATQFIYFGDTNDNDVGDIRYNHTDNSMRFTTNAGGAFMHLTSANRLGLRTGTPLTMFHMTPTNNYEAAMRFSTYGEIGLESNWQLNLNVNASNFSGTWNYINTGAYTGRALNLQLDPNIGWTFRYVETGTDPITWTNFMRVHRNGNVGINQDTPTSKLHVEGPIAVAYVTKSIDYTLTATDSVVTFDASGAARTATLPTAVGIEGRMYTIKKIDSSANTVTLDGNGTETIDWALNHVLYNQGDSVTVISDNANWLVI